MTNWQDVSDRKRTICGILQLRLHELSEPMEIAIRAYVLNQQSNRKYHATEDVTRPDVVLVMDTETTIDESQDLLFGSCGIWISGILHRFILFYALDLTANQIDVIRKHSSNLTVETIEIELMSSTDFVDKVLYPYLYDAHAVLVGFNLPYDLTRLASVWGSSRGKWKGGFTFTLSEDNFLPPVRIKSLDSTKAFIEFARPPKRNQNHPQPHYPGRFLDLRTLSFALTNEHLTLHRACELFQSPIKKIIAKEHGKITPEYIDYNINDTLATYNLYLKMLDRFNSFHLTLPPEKAYSPASAGKQYLKQMGIKPFLAQNPDFPKEILGYVMTTYYGGRSEVRIRKKPAKVRYMDFASMYPSLFSLMNLWSYVTADKIEAIDVTDQTRRTIDNASLENLRNPAVWEDIVTIVQVQPENDILPVRGHYGDKFAFNIGLPYLTSTHPLWYALPDVLASKLLTGKSPRIIRAIRFVPKGVQAGLRSISIVGDSKVNPNEDLFLKLRQLRAKVKKESEQEQKGTNLRDQLESVQEQLKIVANATSYGIFIQVVTSNRKCEVEVYGLNHFKCKAAKRESFGDFFNPIIATMLTSGARLLLAMAESWLEQHGGFYTFCDTDSMAVSPFHWKKLQDYFEPLNPIPEEPGFLKLEKENFDDHGKSRGLWFYGISTKRYVLYTLSKDGNPVPIKPCAHGLGQLKHKQEHAGDWDKELWTNILQYAYGRISEEQLISKYESKFAVAELTLTTPNVLRRVKAINQDRGNSQQIKPYNFVLVGSPAMTGRNGDPIIPVTQFTSNCDLAPFQPFTDSKTGDLYEEHTHMYWKTLDKTVEEYVHHPENKFQNGHSTGRMRRRHLYVRSIVCIGKEVNELEQNRLGGLDEGTYVQYLR